MIQYPIFLMYYLSKFIWYSGDKRVLDFLQYESSWNPLRYLNSPFTYGW